MHRMRIAKQFGRWRGALRRWLCRCQRGWIVWTSGGEDKPAPRYRPRARSRANRRAKPRWMREQVLALYAGGGKSYRQVALEFNRRHGGTAHSVSATTVHDWVQKYATEMRAVQRATRNRVPKHTPPNRRWGVDGTGKADATGHVHFILGIIDHGTRRNLALRRLATATAPLLLEQVLSAVRRHGSPASIRTDNAPVFRSAVFRQGLAAAGIRHEFSAPGKPWQNGRIERLFGTLKQKLNRVVPADGAALDGLLDEFADWYNRIRPHQHLHGHTPLEAWRGVNPWLRTPRYVRPYVAWDGMLTGFDLGR